MTVNWFDSIWMSSRGREEKVCSGGLIKRVDSPLWHLIKLSLKARRLGEGMNYLVSSWQIKRLDSLSRPVRYLTVSSVFTLFTWECVHYKYHSWGNHRAPGVSEWAPPSPSVTCEGWESRLVSSAHQHTCSTFYMCVLESAKEHYIVRCTHWD